MKVGLLLVTHGKLGRHMLDTMTEMMGALPLAADLLEVRRVQSPESMLGQAVKNNSGPAVAYLRSDAAQLPFADGAVDAAICYAALYLINDPQAVVTEIARVVRPGGRISLLTSFEGRLPTPRVGTSVTRLASGMRFFGKDELASWLRAAGMTDVHTQIDGLAQTVTATAPALRRG